MGLLVKSIVHRNERSRSDTCRMLAIFEIVKLDMCGYGFYSYYEFKVNMAGNGGAAIGESI